MARVLIVENDVALKMLMRDVLESEGHEVVLMDFDDPAPSGSFAVLVTDLPTGTYSSDRSRTWVNGLKDRYRGARTIIASAHAEAPREGDRLGADAILTKPFSIEQLILRVAALSRGG